MRGWARPQSQSLRTRVRDAIAVVTALALLMFGAPLAVAVDRLIQNEALAGLQRDATRGVAAVPDNTIETGTKVELPSGVTGGSIGVYSTAGRLVAGRGPAASGLAARVVDGREHHGRDHGDLAVVLPVLSDTSVAGSVRAAVPLHRLADRRTRAWLLLLGLAIAVVLIALLLARRSAGRISAPFELITQTARQIGAGDYSVALPPWGITEADAAADALRDGARQIDAMVEHERSFTRDASHQLRTPLSALLLHLEEHPPDVRAALAQGHHLEATIADLLSLRSTGRSTCDPAAVAASAAKRWQDSGLAVAVRADPSGEVGLSQAALRQSLDVLLDNAARHGAGPVTITVEPFGDVVVVEVADSGPGFPPAARPGTGLQMAARVVERSGGSLLIRRRAPAARVALLLPRAQADQAPQSASQR